MQTTSRSSCSLYPEFDEINEAAAKDVMPIKLPESIKGKKKGLVIIPGPGSSSYHGNQSYQGYQGGYKHEPSCKHEGDGVVFEFQGKKLYACNYSGINEYSGKWDLIIDLASIVRMPASPDDFVKKGNPSRFDILKKMMKPTTSSTIKSEVLRLDWPDYQAAPASLDFWVHLWGMLPAKTAIGCQGGHGRTGTCIASLMIATGMDYYSAVETVRSEHCHKAIESQVQEVYLYNLYTDALNRQLIEAKEANHMAEVKDIEEDLEYAASHKPNAHSYMGGESTPTIDKKKTNGSGGQDSLPILVGGVDNYSDQDFKTVGGKMYIKECMNTICMNNPCTDPDHLSWVEIDDVNLSNSPNLWD